MLDWPLKCPRLCFRFLSRNLGAFPRRGFGFMLFLLLLFFAGLESRCVSFFCPLLLRLAFLFFSLVCKFSRRRPIDYR